jgi:acyl carrier protein
MITQLKDIFSEQRERGRRSVMPTFTPQDILDILRDRLFIDTSTVEPSTPLFSSGLIDSFSLATLIVELETRGEFRIEPLDITLDNLDSIDRMVRFLESRGLQRAN